MNLITYKGKIIVPLILINRVIEQFHDHILGGHLEQRQLKEFHKNIFGHK
jgi:hypothetical protein